jgi:hypothetical protein
MLKCFDAARRGMREIAEIYSHGSERTPRRRVGRLKMLTCVPRASGIMLIVSAKDGVVGVNLPPLYACTNAQRRCYFRLWDVAV